jgi:hypothetical protein
MKKKSLILFVMSVICTLSAHAETVSSFKSGLTQLNKTYILPLLGAGLGIYALVSGVLRIGKIRKGGEEQTDAILNWLGSLLWPVVVVIVSEGIILTFTVFS